MIYLMTETVENGVAIMYSVYQGRTAGKKLLRTFPGDKSGEAMAIAFRDEMHRLNPHGKGGSFLETQIRREAKGLSLLP